MLLLFVCLFVCCCFSGGCHDTWTAKLPLKNHVPMFMGSFQFSEHPRVQRGLFSRLNPELLNCAVGSYSWLCSFTVAFMVICSWVHFRVPNASGLIHQLNLLLNLLNMRCTIVFVVMFMGTFQGTEHPRCIWTPSCWTWAARSSSWLCSWVHFRVLNTHVLIRQLNPKLLNLRCKIVFMLRNAKDTAVSFYHHHLKLPEYEYKGKWANYLDLFLPGKGEPGLCPSVQVSPACVVLDSWAWLVSFCTIECGLCLSVQVSVACVVLYRWVTCVILYRWAWLVSFFTVESGLCRSV